MQHIRSSTNSPFLWLHRLIDAATPTVVILLLSLQSQPKVHDRYIVAGLLAGLFLTFIAQVNGNYTDWRGRALLASLNKITIAWLLSWLGLVAIAFMTKISGSFSRELWLLWALVTPLVLITYRILIRLTLGLLRKGGMGRRRVLIIGAGVLGQRLATTFNHNPWMGFEVAGYLDDAEDKQGKSFNGSPVIGRIADLDELSTPFEEVYICLPTYAEGLIKQLFNQLADTSYIVKYVPDLFSFNLLHSHVEIYQGLPIIGVYDTPLSSRSAQLLKRLEDLSLSAIALALFSPVMLIIALAIKLSSPGPVLFKQTRHGLSGREIQVYKFRSMTTCDNGGNIVQASKNDQRITTVGRFIRRTSLDELPQLLNVLKGEMSMVGPRPHAKAHNEQYRQKIPAYMLRHLAKPGITGYAQVLGYRGETDKLEKMQKRVDADLFYISNWTLWFDIKILFQTVFVGFINKNAY